MTFDIAEVHVEDLLARAEVSDDVDDFFRRIIQHFADSALAEI